MRRGYYSTFCRIWQDGRKAPKGGFRSPVLSLRGGAKPRRGNPSPALSVSCADSSPTGGAKLGLSGPHRPLPPPLGEVPPQGAERVSPAKKKSPGGGLGIDFFPYHVILKIKRGAAGRREPPHKLLSSNRRADQANGGYFFFIWKTREMMPTIKIPN